MSELLPHVLDIPHAAEADKTVLIDQIIQQAVETGYTVADVDLAKPWGGFVRFEYKDGDKFVDEFFPGVDPLEARLGNPEAQLSPKFLVVTPSQRLSWQVHARRAERWAFLTDGAYYRSSDPDQMGEIHRVPAGEVVQFAAGECHRLVGDENGYTIVAEIWQHTDPTYPSDEADITRLADDYVR
jgi:mannose-6-phosphate isomerase-like protein (cupin superfamily)